MSDYWWKGRALDQDTHRAINAQHYPGTRQLCSICDEPTGRCEEDTLSFEDSGPLCEFHYTEQKEARYECFQSKSSQLLCDCESPDDCRDWKDYT